MLTKWTSIATHPKTTTIIKEALKDLKVLNKNDLKTLLKWRANMRAEVLNVSTSSPFFYYILYYYY